MHIDERHSLPRKATTNYKAKMGKGYLTIEQIWFLAKSTAANPKAAHPAYLKEALAAKFAAVSLVDRKDLLDFLTGKVASSANIDLNVPAFADVPGEAARDVAGRCAPAVWCAWRSAQRLRTCDAARTARDAG